MTIHIGMLLYPKLTQLDLTGPFEVLHHVPNAEVHLAWKTIERYEDRSTLYYNLACAEALLGETDAALEHLRTALEGNPSLAAYLFEDKDLAALRDDARFGELAQS